MFFDESVKSKNVQKIEINSDQKFPFFNSHKNQVKVQKPKIQDVKNCLAVL